MARKLACGATTFIPDFRLFGLLLDELVSSASFDSGQIVDSTFGGKIRSALRYESAPTVHRNEERTLVPPSVCKAV